MGSEMCIRDRHKTNRLMRGKAVVNDAGMCHAKTPALSDEVGGGHS